MGRQENSIADLAAGEESQATGVCGPMEGVGSEGVDAKAFADEFSWISIVTAQLFNSGQPS